VCSAARLLLPAAFWLEQSAQLAPAGLAVLLLAGLELLLLLLLLLAAVAGACTMMLV
jgi:hypothetical protein